MFGLQRPDRNPLTFTITPGLCCVWRRRLYSRGCRCRCGCFWWSFVTETQATIHVLKPLAYSEQMLVTQTVTIKSASASNHLYLPTRWTPRKPPNALNLVKVMRKVLRYVVRCRANSGADSNSARCVSSHSNITLQCSHRSITSRGSHRVDLFIMKRQRALPLAVCWSAVLITGENFQTSHTSARWRLCACALMRRRYKRTCARVYVYLCITPPRVNRRELQHSTLALWTEWSHKFNRKAI